MSLVSKSRRSGFTLIELLVVVGIIALLIGILLPALSKARETAKLTLNLSNLRQMGVGVNLYIADSKGYLFAHEGYYQAPGNFVEYRVTGTAYAAELATLPAFSDSADLAASIAAGNQGLATPLITTANWESVKTRKAHWPDYIYKYASEPKMYTSPLVEQTELNELNLNIVITGVYGRVKWGGYGYNQHFMGWEATLDSATGAVTKPAFYAKLEKDVTAPADTVLIGDGAGTRNSATKRANSYTIEGPLPSDTLGWKFQKFYKSAAAASAGGAAAIAEETALTESPGTDTWLFRCYPAPRNNGAPGFVFADGHAAIKKLAEIDDHNGDGVFDNGYWNGRADPNPNTR